MDLRLRNRRGNADFMKLNDFDYKTIGLINKGFSSWHSSRELWEWTGLPAQGRLLIRLPITWLPATVAYWTFVPFTAAGQRGLCTPLPQIHSVSKLEITSFPVL